MQYIRRDNIYIVTRITGNRDNILGVCFSENDEKNNKNNIDVIEWNPRIRKGYIPNFQTSRDEVLEQVLCGLKIMNESLETNYKLSKIYFLSAEDGSNSIYEGLISRLILHYHKGNEFIERPLTSDWTGEG
jgi:hypothetical protein